MLHQHDVVVVGGGQAGLAVGYFLKRQGRRFVILDAAREPAAAWRERWDSLRLFTPARYDGLPAAPFPGDPDHYPTRDEVVEYLTSYARTFELPVELDSRVRRIRPQEDGGYLVELHDRSYEAEHVVVATGPFGVPRIPAVAAQLDAGVVQLHSSAYRAPDDLPSRRVLVVGGGNTGFQIAEELADTREVHLSIGTRQTPLPQRILGRDLFRVLEATGLMGKTADSRIGKRLKDRDALIGSNPRAARTRHGIRLHPRTSAAAAATVSFADGSSRSVDGVVWATGFGIDHSWVDVPVFDETDRLVHERGVTASDGLYFLGLPWQHTRGSALLGWVKDDAEHVARHIAASLAKRPAAASAPG
jgi:putative flavoprotein involved in K+ transport